MFAQGAQALQFVLVWQHGFALGHQAIHGGAQAGSQRRVGQSGFGIGFEGFGDKVYGLLVHAVASTSLMVISSGNTANTTKSRGP